MEKKTVGQKVKGHFKKHKVKYIIGGVCIVVGGTVGYYLGNKGIINVQLVNTGSVEQHQYIDKSVNVLTRRGHAGNVVRCVETGEVFASQNRACDLLGLNRADLSNHLNGIKDEVKGLHFEKIDSFNKEDS